MSAASIERNDGTLVERCGGLDVHKAQVTATVGIDERGAADLLGVSARHMLEALACRSGRGGGYAVASLQATEPADFLPNRLPWLGIVIGPHPRDRRVANTTRAAMDWVLEAWSPGLASRTG